MRKQNVLLLTWLALPLIIIAGLLVWIVLTIRAPKPMADAPPIGAGAGDTGGANAIGERLFGIREPGADQIAEAEEALRDEQEGRVPADAIGRGLFIRAIDESGTANPGRPLLLRVAHSDRLFEMNQQQDGSWALTLTPDQTASGETTLMAFEVGRDDERTVALDASGEAAEPVAPPLIDPRGLEAGAIPRVDVRLRAFGLPPAPSH